MNKEIMLMIHKIEDYENKKISLRQLHENLWGIFEVIEPFDKKEAFIDNFHKFWDYVEEIIASELTNEYHDKIDEDLIPNFKNYLFSLK